MSAIAFAVEIRIDGKWYPAQRADRDYNTEALARMAAREFYPITVAIQTNHGPVGIRVMEVVLA